MSYRALWALEPTNIQGPLGPGCTIILQGPTGPGTCLLQGPTGPGLLYLQGPTGPGLHLIVFTGALWAPGTTMFYRALRALGYIQFSAQGAQGLRARPPG